MFKVAPLSGSFMLVSMFGILFSTMFLVNLAPDWAFIVGFISICMFVASLISMTHAPIEAELQLDKPPKRKIVRKHK